MPNPGRRDPLIPSDRDPSHVDHHHGLDAFDFSPATSSTPSSAITSTGGRGRDAEVWRAERHDPGRSLGLDQ